MNVLGISDTEASDEHDPSTGRQKHQNKRNLHSKDTVSDTCVATLLTFLAGPSNMTSSGAPVLLATPTRRTGARMRMLVPTWCVGVPVCVMDEDGENGMILVDNCTCTYCRQ